ncbi:MAG: hypothetical protein Q4D62_02610 [Planctomycetia bacterium]|nr:hypothetical protein [Planctomycetia bacterium]
MEKTFLNWSYPCLPTLAELLVRRHQWMRTVDLSEYLFFFPSRLATRRFLTILADIAYREKLTIEVPKVRFLGDLPEEFYTPKHPFASMLVQQIVWMKAIRALPEVTKEDCQHWLSRPLREDVISDWLELGEKVAEIHQELRKECLYFRHVVDCCRRREKEGTGSCEETRRWELLAKAQERYFDMLDLLEVEDKQESRYRGLVEWQPSELLRGVQRIGLVGCVEMTGLIQQFIKHMENCVEVFIYAPWEYGERFLENGMLKPGAWEEMDPQAAKRLSQTWKQADTPYQQGADAIRWMETLRSRHAADEFTIGFARESLEPQVGQMLRLSGMVPDFLPKKEMSHLTPWQLLRRVACCLKEMVYDPAELEVSETLEKVSPQWDSFVALLRHPDLGEYFRHRCNIEGDWLSELDMFEKHFQPERIFSYHRFCIMTHGEYPVLQEVYAALLRLLEKMVTHYEHFGHIVPLVVDFFKDVYCWKSWYNPQDEEDYQILRGCMEINVLNDKLQLPETLNRTLSISLVEALELVVKKASSRTISPTNRGDLFSFQRWSDLLVDDCPAVLVAGLDERIVPEENCVGEILTEELRQELGIRTAVSQYERNLYILLSLLHSRSHVRFLFQGDPADTWKRKTFSGKIITEKWPLPGVLPSIPKRRKMNVEEFSYYVTSSSKYYMNEILQLQDTRDVTLEMRFLLDGLFRRVLHQFSEEEMYRQRYPNFVPMSLEREAQRYLKLLRDFLDKEYRKSFDATTRPPIFVQKERIRGLLPALAAEQARRTLQGWRIHRVGIPLQVMLRSSGGAGEIVTFSDGKRLELSGMLERVDIHPVRNEWVVWHYLSDMLPEDPFRIPLSRHMILSARQDYQHDYNEIQKMPFARLQYGTIQLAEPHFRIVLWDSAGGEKYYKWIEFIAERIHGGDFSQMTLPESLFFQEQPISSNKVPLPIVQ